MKLTRLLERLEYEVRQGSDGIEVTELINDSRKVTEGSVFVCISGAVSDGHDYIEDVAEKGAAAVIVERPVEAPEGMTVIHVDDTRYALALMSAAYFGYPAEKLKVIGITGTKGKTTTTYMVKSILEGVGHKVGLIGTIERSSATSLFRPTTRLRSPIPSISILHRCWRLAVTAWSWRYHPGADASPDSRDPVRDRYFHESGRGPHRAQRA